MSLPWLEDTRRVIAAEVSQHQKTRNQGGFDLCFSNSSDLVGVRQTPHSWGHGARERQEALPWRPSWPQQSPL